MTQAIALRNAADVPEADVKALATRILNNKPLFPDDLTPQQAAELAMIALAYGLDPLAGELQIFESKPLVTLDGRIRVAAEDPAFDGIEYTRPATEDERGAFHVAPNEDMWVAAVWKKGVRFPSVGYGRAGGAYERNALVTGSKRTGYNPGRGPELARKRSIVNALRLLFPLPRPTIPGQDAPLGYRVEEADVDVATGEIIEARALPGITPEQTKAIHATAKRAGYDEAHYRERLRRMFGVASSQELNEAQAQAAIAAFAQDASEPTAEERVAARRGGDEEPFYQQLEAAGSLHPSDEPRFFKQTTQPAEDVAWPEQSNTPGTRRPFRTETPAVNEPTSAAVTSEHDPLWARWQQLCAEAVAWNVGPDDIPELRLPIGQASLIECGQLLGGLVAQRKGTHALADARERLRERGQAQQLTVPQLDGLLEHSFGRGVTLATCTIDQAHQALELFTNESAAPGPATESLL